MVTKYNLEKIKCKWYNLHSYTIGFCLLYNIIDDLNNLLIIWGRRTASPDKKKTQKLFRLEELIIKNLELLIFIQIVLYIRVNKFLVSLRLVRSSPSSSFVRRRVRVLLRPQSSKLNIKIHLYNLNGTGMNFVSFP